MATKKFKKGDKVIFTNSQGSRLLTLIRKSHPESSFWYVEEAPKSNSFSELYFRFATKLEKILS